MSYPWPDLDRPLSPLPWASQETAPKRFLTPFLPFLSREVAAAGSQVFTISIQVKQGAGVGAITIKVDGAADGYSSGLTDSGQGTVTIQQP